MPVRLGNELKKKFHQPVIFSSMFARYAVALSFGFLIEASAVSNGHSASHLRVVPKKGPTSSYVQASAVLSEPSNAGSYVLREADASEGGSWTLRLCNAYAYAGWVHVFHSYGRRPGMSYTSSGGDGEQQLTKASGPLPYKRCTDIEKVALSVGSMLKFRIGGDMHIGSFSVDQLPMHDSMLQVVLKRRDSWSTTADFSSHVFVNSQAPQIALVNAYIGPARSALEVRTVPSDLFDGEMLQGMLREDGGGEPGPDEEVHFGNVVEIAAGSYEWRLMNLKGPRQHAEKASVEFKAWDRTAYTVLRVGTEAIGGQSYKEELIVWPADGATVRSGNDGDGPDKGLFGIPKDLGQRNNRQRSSAAPKLVSAVVLSIAATLATA